MLLNLAIRNYATAADLTIEFEAGMTAITGETGAGKSIILGALGLALGDRADKTVIRPGASKADITALFGLEHLRAARDWLQLQDLLAEEDEESCLLRRVINSDGRSRAYINDNAVTLANLKTLGEMLLDIHGQHEHQSLLRRRTHQRLLDEFAVAANLRKNLQTTWRQWQQNHQELLDLSSQSEENSAESQLLRYQLNELEELGIGEDEVARLEAEFKTLDQADVVLATSQAALDLLSEAEAGNVASMLHRASTGLTALSGLPPRLTGALELLDSAAIQVEEATGELRAFNAGFQADPGRLEEVNARLGTLHDLARKHRVKAEELPELMTELSARLDKVENSDAELEQLRSNDELLREQYNKLARQQSQQRRRGAARLASAVNAQLEALSMPHARLEVSLQPIASEVPLSGGQEQIEFMVSTNPGQPSQPLGKIASGGELSRISLAIQVITARTSQVPSLVFDEVDVGIGGGVARIVGELLRGLSEQTQILCVTHQAQVAGQGHHHLLVSKVQEKNKTETRISHLEGQAVVREVARMLGGDSYSEESLAHAEQMLATQRTG